MSCNTKTLQCVLYLLNLLIVILGAVLIWFAVWLRTSIAPDVPVAQGEHLAASLTIVLGAVVLLTGIFGALVTYLRLPLMLTHYAIVLVVLLVVQLVLVHISYAATSDDGLAQGLKQGFDELWEGEADDETGEVAHNSTLSHYEQWLQCCGKHSAQDYLLLDTYPPSSCCKERDCTNPLHLYVDGCERRFREYITSRTSNFKAISWLLIVLEFVGSVFACVLIDRIRNHRDRIRLYS